MISDINTPSLKSRVIFFLSLLNQKVSIQSNNCYIQSSLIGGAYIQITAINTRYKQSINLMNTSIFKRTIHKKIGKSIFLTDLNSDQALQTLDQIHFQNRKMEKRWTMYWETRLNQNLRDGQERKRYWVETVRHYNQKKMSFFVTNVLANKKISVPLR